MRDDEFDVDLEDEELLEVELTVNLIVAASDTHERFPQHRIDEILGVAIPKPRSRAELAEVLDGRVEVESVVVREEVKIVLVAIRLPELPEPE
ncbi:MAG: hypothetical protein ACRDOX_02285 [Nocardioides sp.]